MDHKKTLKDYQIRHILNNSSIIVDGYFTEKILMGKGIGFGHKPDDTLQWVPSMISHINC